MGDKGGGHNLCEECGSAGAGDDGLCAACRGVKEGKYDSRREYFQEIGSKGGSVPRNASGRLSLEGLPPLEDHGSVKVWLEYLAQELAAGRAGRQLVSELRKILKEWVSVHRSEVTDEVLDELRAEIEELARRQDRMERQQEPWAG